LTSRQYPQRIAFADAPGVKDMLIAGTSWLEKHVPVVNALNVFPVPDGDTGTNMFLTMQASVQEMSTVSEHSVAAVMHAAAHGALMGARGNSGVIMSQILRGMARSFAKKETATVRDLADAFAEGSATAYKGVIRPVEGTLLTVAKDVAAAAAKAASEDDDLRHLIDAVVVAARESVAFTPNLLPVLKEAGVVDAGGQGFCIILEGIWHLLRGDDMQVASPAYAETVDLHTPSGDYGYDVQFILQGDRLVIDDVRTRILTFGDSVLVVGDSHTIKVHVHTTNPGEVLTYGATQGAISKVIVENMQEQYQEYLARQSKTEVSHPPLATTGITTVAVVSGEGLVRVFHSLGVTTVIPGGQTMNPSTAEILQAIDQAPSDRVIVLPNNGNIVMAARAAQDLTKKQVAIVPTDTIPQGIAALLAFNSEADLETNRRHMERAVGHVQTAEITMAVRSTRFEGFEVKAGAVIGLLNGKLLATGDDIDDVVRRMLDHMRARDREIITIYYGETVTLDEARHTEILVREHCPQQEVELVDGGQLYYSYIISSE
jgi:uncharacterized protein